jgi:rhamnosyltransferase
MINCFKLIKDEKEIELSGLFDKKYYLFTYPDVRTADLNPIQHYLRIGAKEGRNPSSYFDTKFYLDSNADVRSEEINPLLHFIKYGKEEGRHPKKLPSAEQKTILSVYLSERERKSLDIAKRRILIFSHYNKQNLLSDYVIFTLQKMNHLFSKIIFVSNSLIDSESLSKISVWCDKILVRNNVGFDFGGWKDAILEEGWDNLSSYDSLTLMNDLCFGPVHDLTQLYADMEEKKVDFFSLARKEGVDSDFIGIGHLSSQDLCDSFFVFNNRIADLKDFINYCGESTHGYSKKIIFDHLRKKKYQCLFLSIKTNSLERNKYFVNIQKLLDFDHPKFGKQAIKADISSLEDYIDHTYPPNTSSRINDKNILLCGIGEKAFNSSVAVHIHVFYVDVLDKILSIISMSTKVDVFVTTTVDKKNEVELVLEKYNLHKFKKNIFVFENRGRNILPWLKISNHLNNYEIVGHFHTKKSNFFGQEWFGDAWMGEIVNSTVVPFREIIHLMEANSKVGVVIPEMPHFFKFLMKACPFDGSSGVNRKNIQQLWSRLKMKKICDFNSLDTPIMSYGAMFWYRPEALKSLTEYPFLEKEFPEEPLPRDGTIAHAIERLPVYVAWNEGFDYRVALTQNTISSGFDYKVNFNRK